MAKRIRDNEIWKKDWYLDLSIKHKLLVDFLYDNCDCAGVYEISKRILNYVFGGEITIDDFEILLNLEKPQFKKTRQWENLYY